MSLLSSAAKLLASLDLDTKPFEAGQKRVNRDLGQMETRFQKISTRSIALGSAIGTGIERIAEKGIGALFSNIQQGEEHLRELQDITAQTGAVIESTGGKAGITAQQVRDLASAQEDLTTVDDKVVQSGENMLLTFTNIGKGVFPDATKAMVDMAVAMNGGNAEGIDLKNTAIQIGKALNDPIKGVTALRKVGVQLTAQQEKQIKAFIKAGDIESAQKVILKELTTEFGKAGEAAGNSGAAGVRRLSDAVEDSQIALAQGLAPALDRIRTKIATALKDPKTQEAIRHLGEWLGDAAEKGLAFAESIPWGTVGEGLKTAAGFAGKLIDAFAHMPPGVQATIIGLAGLNKLAGGGVIKVGVDLLETGAKSLFGQLLSRGSPANPMFVVAEGGLGGGVPGAAVGAAGGIVGAAVSWIIPAAAGIALGTAIGNAIEPYTTAFIRERIKAPIQKDANGNAVEFRQFGKVDKSVKVATDPGVAESLRKNLQPLPDNITKKQERKFDALRERIEGSRISTVQRLSTLDATTKNVATAERNGSAAIVRAIQNQQLRVSLNLRLRAAGLSAYQSATFLSRANRLESKGID